MTKIGEEVRREQEQKAGTTAAEAPLRVGEVFARHQAVVSDPAPARRGRPRLTQEGRELREVFAPYVAHMATKLHDEAKLASSLGRFVNVYLAARERRPDLLPETMFVLGE